MQLDASLAPRKANFVPLTPVDFLKRSVEVFPQRAAIVHGERIFTYAQFGQLVGELAAALRRDGIEAGDVVSVIAGNRPEMLALHFAVPMIGAVLNTINTRLDAATIAYILAHAEARTVFVDVEGAALVEAARAKCKSELQVVCIGAAASADSSGLLESYLGGVEAAAISLDAIADEWQPLSLSYTSGTTGHPKGVVYHHRGAFLNSLGNVLALGFDQRTTYLWVLPMFHCNGWQHPWAVTAVGGRHVCLDRVDPAAIFRAIEALEVTHFSCAPVVLYMLLNHPDRSLRNAGRRVKVATGGAAPTAALIEGLERLGFEPVHMYGLTESYGPATLNVVREDCGSAEEKARLLSRQGVRHPCVAAVDVVDQNGLSVPADGATMGEIVIRSNTLAAGYYKDEEATETAFAGDIFHTGDLAVRHPDGHLQIRDRAKDLIISGGENISSLEVESVLHQHPAVMIAAVVALPDPKWGEIPCACIELKPGVQRPSEDELIAFCRERLAHFKVPRRITYRELPKTATGKIQKYALRAALAEA